MSAREIAKYVIMWNYIIRFICNYKFKKDMNKFIWKFYKLVYYIERFSKWHLKIYAKSKLIKNLNDVSVNKNTVTFQNTERKLN